VLAGLTGCARMDAALTRQWMTVVFTPHVKVADVLHVRAACSHIQNTPPLPMPVPAPNKPIKLIYGVRFDTTNSSPANLAELQVCLQKFKLVLGVNAQDTGSQGG
jgi:hypothetical protein